MLHALSAHYALEGDSRYAKELAKALPAYVHYAGKVASGVAHALEAAAVHQCGITVIKVGEKADLKGLREALAMKSWRRVFIKHSAEIPLGNFQICIGTKCHAPTGNLDKALALF